MGFSNYMINANSQIQPKVSTAEQLLRNGLRVLLTGRCNYKCFFCHNEGFDPIRVQDSEVDTNSIIRFVQHGVRNLTFSGGEPLLVYNRLTTVLDALISNLERSVRNQLEITIVTNGNLLNSEKIEQLANYAQNFSGIRLNISLHSPDAAIYDAVTRTKGQHSKVVRNIRYAIKAGLEVRLNFVLLRNYNSHSAMINEIMEFSSSLGVNRIKIIEFLITKLNRDFYSSFSRLDPIMYNNHHHASMIEKYSRRKITHTYSKTGLTVDFTRCTCALGCKDCVTTRELEIGPNNTVIGCIAMPPKTYDPLTDSPIDIADIAAQQLLSMVKRYGHYSPSLVFAPENVAGKGIFSISPCDGVTDLINSRQVVTFRKYRETKLIHRSQQLTQQEFSFLLTESAEETHSRITCFREHATSINDMNWCEIEFFDPVYDFSRTRANVNKKKIRAMGYIPLQQMDIEEDTVLLTEPGKDVFPVLLRRRRVKPSGRYKLQFEVLRSKDDIWPNGEPLSTAIHTAKLYNLQLVPLESSEDIVTRKMAFFRNRYCDLIEHISCDQDDKLGYAMRIAFNVLLLYNSIELQEREEVNEETLFLSALIYNQREQFDLNDIEIQDLLAKWTIPNILQYSIIKILDAFPTNDSTLSMAQKLLQDAILLDCFNIRMIRHLYEKNHSQKEIYQYIRKYLRASSDDFNYEQTRMLAIPGWYYLLDYVRTIEPDMDGIPEHPHFAPVLL